MFSLDALALTVSFLWNAMTHLSVSAFISTCEVGTFVARASGGHPALLSTQDSKQMFKDFFHSLKKINPWCCITKTQQLCSRKKPSRVVQRISTRISPALITLYVHTGVSLEDAIGSCSVTQTAATVSVWVAMEMWWFILLAVHKMNR